MRLLEFRKTQRRAVINTFRNSPGEVFFRETDVRGRQKKINNNNKTALNYVAYLCNNIKSIRKDVILVIVSIILIINYTFFFLLSPRSRLSANSSEPQYAYEKYNAREVFFFF